MLKVLPTFCSKPERKYNLNCFLTFNHQENKAILDSVVIKLAVKQLEK